MWRHAASARLLVRRGAVSDGPYLQRTASLDRADDRRQLRSRGTCRQLRSHGKSPKREDDLHRSGRTDQFTIFRRGASRQSRRNSANPRERTSWISVLLLLLHLKRNEQHNTLTLHFQHNRVSVLV